MPDIRWRESLEAAKREIGLVVNALRDKGGRRFSRAIVFAGLSVFIAYTGIYEPQQKKIARLEREIQTAKAMSESGARYKELRDQLAAVYALMPQIKDREQWLSGALVESLRAVNLTPDSLKPVLENTASGLIFQSSTLQLTVKFEDLYSWLTRVEGGRPMMHVQSLEIAKKPEQIGWNSVTCDIATVIPKKRFN